MVSNIPKQLATFPLGILCNANPAVQALGSQIRPLSLGAKIAGPAITARVAPGQNGAIHRAVHRAKPGEVLVVDGGGSTSFGAFGDILAKACQMKGVVGAVIDGTVRDSAEIRELGFPVFCLGINPTAAQKSDPGEIDTEISCGGVQVAPGDFVVADDDGVVVVPKALVTEVLKAAHKVAMREAKIIEQLEAGRSTVEIFDIE